MIAAPIETALNRLNGLLPLQERQLRLTASLRNLHVAILRDYALHGRPPSRTAMERLVGDVDSALQRLADDDLIVLTPDKTAISGAYPFTSESRAHRVAIDGREVHAMCALDAVSIAPMFELATCVRSQCHVQATPVEIHMQGARVLATTPAHPYVGIRWQSTAGCAAQSLCLEMVFLADRATAEAWQRDDPDNIDLFTLPDAVAFGAAFFRPLLADADQSMTMGA